MNNYNFIIGATDTDSISFCDPNSTPMSKEYRQALIKELNDISPEYMVWEDDGYYTTMICVKAKNYVMVKEDGTIIYKGNTIKAPMKEPALQEFIKALIQEILDETFRFEELYNKYVQEILNITDIKRWVCKKTISEKVLNSDRTNEENIRNAIADTEYQEGDKVYGYFDTEGNFKLQEHYANDHSQDKLFQKLFDTAKLFGTLIEVEEVFLNYKLKRNKKVLEEKFG